ncbi:triphosphoribosyl-dephospho-CoA synthase CitG [Uliginosibacterium gangwonense]|uniref:triphosphoribosyl-dephospho-CoA synthase CitG n=1 Tax=Uliginosibacterium gangwonense TaxID=392736 RepID=UPI00036A6A72|nr:triphosphoribosyl-dephospho-CoA synthase CitG [Uliginosibacterium gangwonense]
MDIAVSALAEAYHSLRHGQHDPARLAEAFAHLAYQALVTEVELTPKPGLVDRRNTGAHHDMDVHTFYASAQALKPWFASFYRCGVSHSDLPADYALLRLREEGLAAERDMFQATAGVNTHKGALFALGLLCAAAGRLVGQGIGPDRESLCEEVARLCEGLVRNELNRQSEAQTAGEHLFQRYGLTGARGEAASGFATVRHYGLPAFEEACLQGVDEEAALLAALLNLMAHNPDTNVVSRGGLEGLAFVQGEAQALLARGGIHAPGFMADFIALDEEMITRHLSPGGSADLLALTWFLSRLPA